jgi:hypothetical protein
MDLTTGFTDPQYKLAIANPELDPLEYMKIIKSIQSPRLSSLSAAGMMNIHKSPR